jgi:hypothetical protein
VLAERLKAHVTYLSGTLGEHNMTRFPKQLEMAADYIEKEFRGMGLTPKIQTYTIKEIPQVKGQTAKNISVEISGTSRPDEIIVIGAHYDSVEQAPGADDNSSGVAGMLEMARRFATHQPNRTLRFVAWTNEEPPYFWTQDMGSLVYAKECREKNENIIVGISLECLGFYSDQSGSQKYPFPLGLFYPPVADFVSFVGNTASKRQVHDLIKLFREKVKFPSDGAALPGTLEGIGWSDHWSFWEAGYPGVVVTDTAYLRNDHYHTGHDSPNTLDYEKMARVIYGMNDVIESYDKIVVRQ